MDHYNDIPEFTDSSYRFRDADGHSRTVSPLESSGRPQAMFVRPSQPTGSTEENSSHIPELPGHYHRPIATETSENGVYSNDSDERKHGFVAVEVKKKYEDSLIKPMKESEKLGSFSVAALIINKMIGTGIFSKPSAILRSTGSKGASIFMWVAGGIMTLTALLVYLEFGIKLPFNGGELIYLDQAYPRPRYLASCVFAVLFVLLGNTAANCIAFAKQIIQAFRPEIANPDQNLVKFIALCVITLVCLIHFFSRKMGIVTNNLLALYKLVLLTFVVVSGFAALGGARVGGSRAGDTYGTENFKNSFKTNGDTRSPRDYAGAMLSVLYAFQGWENANYVLAEVKRPPNKPEQAFKRGALMAFGSVTILYIFANVAYFAASSYEELENTGVTVAAEFFEKVFGPGEFVRRGLRVFIALSAFGNVLAVTYSNSRVKQEIARQRILPFSHYWARNSPYRTPVGALTLHWIFTAIVIVATPNYTKNDEAYNFISVLFTYGHTWVGIFIAAGILLLPLQTKFSDFRPKILGKKMLTFCAVASIILNLFIVIIIWWPAARAPGERIWPMATPLVATSVLGAGLIYWFVIAKGLQVFGWRLESKPVELPDGSEVQVYEWTKAKFALRFDRWWKARRWNNTDSRTEQ